MEIYADERSDGTLLNIRCSSQCGDSSKNPVVRDCIRVTLVARPVDGEPGPFRRDPITGMPVSALSVSARQSNILTWALELQRRKSDMDALRASMITAGKKVTELNASIAITEAEIGAMIKIL